MSDWLFIAVTGAFFLGILVKAIFQDPYGVDVLQAVRFLVTMILGLVLWVGFLFVLIYAIVPAFNALVVLILNAFS